MQHVYANAKIWKTHETWNWLHFAYGIRRVLLAPRYLSQFDAKKGRPSIYTHPSAHRIKEAAVQPVTESLSPLLQLLWLWGGVNESVAGSISGSRFAIDLAKLHVSSITFEQWSERQRVPLGFPAIYGGKMQVCFVLHFSGEARKKKPSYYTKGSRAVSLGPELL